MSTVTDLSSSSEEEEDLVVRVRSLLAHTNVEKTMRGQRSPISRSTFSTLDKQAATPSTTAAVSEQKPTPRKDGATKDLEGQLKEFRRKYEDEIEQFEVEIATERAAKTRALLELSECKDKLTEKEQEVISVTGLYKKTKEKGDALEESIKVLEEKLEALQTEKEAAKKDWEEKSQNLLELLEEEKEGKRRAEKEKDDTREEIERMTSSLGQDAKEAAEFISQLKSKAREAESLASKNARLTEDLKLQLEKEKQRADGFQHTASALQEQIKKEREANNRLIREVNEAKVFQEI
jgi:chromosome segregation ATPase